VAAVQPTEQRGDRMPGRHVTGPVGADQQPGPAVVGEPLEQRGALRVGPVQILEHDDRRPVRRHLVDQRQSGVQPLDRAQRAVGQRAQPGRVDIGPAVEGVHQHLVRPRE
jgi:hypothetical protein